MKQDKKQPNDLQNRNRYSTCTTKRLIIGGYMYRLYKCSQIPPFSEKCTLVFHFFSTDKILTSPTKICPSPKNFCPLTDNIILSQKTNHSQKNLLFPRFCQNTNIGFSSFLKTEMTKLLILVFVSYATAILLLTKYVDYRKMRTTF